MSSRLRASVTMAAAVVTESSDGSLCRISRGYMVPKYHNFFTVIHSLSG